MRNYYRRSLLIISFIFLIGISVPIISARAQTVGYDWSGPERLSNKGTNASEGVMVSDQYGYVHTFWIETGLIPERAVILYSRFDGTFWLPPIDIRVGSGGVIPYLSAAVDSKGYLHLLWNEGVTGPVFYTYAPAYGAQSVQNWAPIIQIQIPAAKLKILVDENDIIHIFYAEIYSERPGVYYISSSDEGDTWTEPIWIDPDIPESYVPQDIQFEMGDSGWLHAVWYYIDLDGGGGKWIRYAHSVDGGESWSTPFTIDIADDAIDELRLPHPELAVEGKNVHIVYAGDSETHREYRYSSDGGKTWQPVRRILGNLVGQALGGGLEIDSSGRVHYFAQIRYPQGIYHGIWEDGQWSIPELIYLISLNADDEFAGRIHAHNVRLAIREGKQLVVSFTDSPGVPNGGLYVMTRTMEDIPALQLLPLPTEAELSSGITLTLTPTLTPIGDSSEDVAEPEPTRQPAAGGNVDAGTSGSLTTPGNMVFFALAPIVLFVLGILVFQLIRKLTRTSA
jgi:hypothetical protein